VKNLDGNWYAGGVEADQSLGHGTYRWYTVGKPDQLDSNLVARLSTYYDISHELDIEFAQGYQDEPTNIFYTVQPYYVAGHRYADAHSFTGTLTTHEFAWTPRRVAYRSWYGHCAEPPSPSATIAQWSYEGGDVPDDTNELVRMSLWMLDAIPPASSQELVIADFIYECATGTVLLDDFEDGILSNIWERYNDSGSQITESNGQLRITPANVDDDSLGIRTTNTFSWNDDGLSYIFDANLATITVTSARGTGGADVWSYQSVISGENGIYDPYSASNAAILRAGYDQSADQLTLEFLTKTGLANSWGTSRYMGTIDNASSFFNGSGLDLRFSLVYSNYAVSATYQGNPVSITLVSGASTGVHNLGNALYNYQYVAGAQNHDDGRGSIYWNEVHLHTDAELSSTTDEGEGSGPGEKTIQIGDADHGTTWRAPIDTRYIKHRSEMLYHADLIDRPGTITQLQVYVLAPPDITIQDYTIRMRTTTDESLTEYFINDGWTNVYEADTLIPSGTRGWYAFDLSTPFHYNGSDNLLIDFIFDISSTDDDPLPTASYTYSDYDGALVCSASRDDPFTWSTYPRGRKFKHHGNRMIDVRLVFADEAPAAIGENLSFEDGPQGFLTNVPSWEVEGSAYAGAIKGSPVFHKDQSLKLWKDGGNGDQKLCQYFSFSSTNEYTLTGYILTQSSEPFKGSNAYGALLLRWYGASGLLRTDTSGHFSGTNVNNVWFQYSVSGTPPSGTTSGQICCALFSSPDQEGSLFFDRLEMTAQPASSLPDGTPLPIVTELYDEFNDTTMSNCWSRAGDFADTEYEETNGAFRIRPGTNWTWQSSGYVSVQPTAWNNTNGWCVFSALLSTVEVDSVSGTNDIEILLSISSEPENAWYVTNSISLYGYYSATDNYIIMQLLTKTDLPGDNGNERFNGMITNVSSYFGITNGIRISIALGQDQYDLRFNDGAGHPVPFNLNAGSTRGLHYLGEKLTNAYWYVGAQNDSLKRGSVYWNRTEVFKMNAPVATGGNAAQISTDGQGLVSITNLVSDPNGDACRLQLQASTNSGADWFSIQISTLTSSLPCSIVSDPWSVQVMHIQTTNDTYKLATNEIVVTWNTQLAGLTNTALTNVQIRLLADDGYVGASVVTGTAFVVDNLGPSPTSAVITVESGDAYTFKTNLDATWSGFTDISGVIGFYYSLDDNGGTTSGVWATSSPGTVNGVTPDATNLVYVWARDTYGNIGASASDAIVILTEANDYDEDDMPNGWEDANSLSPINSADATSDDDLDGYTAREEFYFDTDPQLQSSSVRFETGGNDVDNVIVRWIASTGRVYSIYFSDIPGDTWQPVAGQTNMPGISGTMSCTNSLNGLTSRCFRIGVKFP